jgi:hypothetical protein
LVKSHRERGKKKKNVEWSKLRSEVIYKFTTTFFFLLLLLLSINTMMTERHEDVIPKPISINVTFILQTHYRSASNKNPFFFLHL